MRVLLLYPPPWQVPLQGQLPSQPYDEGPPEGFSAGDLDPDFYQLPYGLLCLATEARRCGHEVRVWNLSSFAWPQVEQLLERMEADLVGISCWTANRRGAIALARQLRVLHPRSPIVFGGPHATALPLELLAAVPEVDLVCIGEGERPFLTMLERLEAGEGLAAIPGTAYREQGVAVRAPSSPQVESLDLLERPQRHYHSHIFMTSRGCPWNCTFCGAENSWGRGFRGHSPAYVLASLATCLPKLPVKMLQVKDDTFTANPKRALEICRGIREQGMRFAWSCDTRVDVLNPELLRQMRLAGCQRLSLGVESGSEQILKAIDKRISKKAILEATRMAKAVGIEVRYYMMLGNRGETWETFQESLAFLEEAKPHEVIFSCLSVYPGTPDYDLALSQGWLTPQRYFDEKFIELKVPFDAPAEDAAEMNRWFLAHRGVQRLHEPTVAECCAILEELSEPCASATLDLALALYREEQWAEAERRGRECLADHPLPGLVLNLLAAVAAAQGDWLQVKEHLVEAGRRDPQHWVLRENARRAQLWFASGGPSSGEALQLEVRQGFQLFEQNLQPALPGPIAPEELSWSDPRAAVTRSPLLMPAAATIPLRAKR